MAGTIVLSNDYHDTTVTLRPTDGLLRGAQLRRAWSALCGVAGCTCGDNGIRGSQVQPDGAVLHYEWVSDSSISVAVGSL